ncbi:MAG: tRNA (guanosine(37)-N1)-methyltransferase TrmD [Candidatus Cloacimonetes bacterium]|nr:tRNA (guanosine(37)-N1)-methyltransferase TrmD [Candidatus Cloacimonadota bacterium]MCF7867462.1 tRNA (guanosine(37)-N1)-methyltransferase TrmD [Candidatus Cloacimonadota bacterium]MCF7882906.1 tRNA (guanosine(37)-N1)-methyltransferase TrmD [Candidatus Cloacimonadota bacterium]
MKIHVLTLFPGMFKNFLQESMVGIAIDQKAIEINLVDIRDFAHDKHKTCDDSPYGGGAGMVMKPEPIYEAIMHARQDREIPVIYFTPQGELLKQPAIIDFSKLDEVILLCGHYKEIDQRIRDNFVDYEFSIGDYVLSGGEIPAMVFIDAVSRLQEGVLGDIDSALTDSHHNGILGCPHYTRPPEFMGFKVPDVLISGHHKKIKQWRQKKALEITRKNRPDLLKNEE